jgi:hypothetical protein
MNVQFVISDPARYGVAKPMALLGAPYELLEDVLAIDGNLPNSWVCGDLVQGLHQLLQGNISRYEDGLNDFAVIATPTTATVQFWGGADPLECEVSTPELYNLLLQWCDFVDLHRGSRQ